MANVCDTYSVGIKRSLQNYWAAWLPSTQFELGDVGTLKGALFTKVTTLTELGITFTPKTDHSSTPLELVSESGVSYAIKAKGEANDAFPSIPQASAGVKIDFAAEGAFVVQCPATYEPEIDEPLALGRKIKEAASKGVWNRKWYVITRIIKAPVATVFVANSSSAGLEASASADLSDLCDIGKASVGFAVKSSHGDIMKMIAAEHLTPFFQLSQLKTRYFSAPEFETTMGLTVADAPASRVVRKAVDSFELVTDDEIAVGD